MINIDLISDSPISVQVSLKPTVASRIGEIILLPNEAYNEDEAFTSRPPWENLLVANEWSIKTGRIYAKLSSDFVFLTAQVWNIDQISKLAKQELAISLIQKNEDNGLQAAMCYESFLEGIEIIKNKISIAFKINRSEMIYNR